MMRGRKLCLLCLLTLFFQGTLVQVPLCAGSATYSKLLAARTDAAPKAQRRSQARTQNARNKAATSSDFVKSPGQENPRPFTKIQSVLAR
ncbi:MAG: hypothetical protein IKN64_00600 [Desulfovibrio sp.]|nr:hypothetical protein [Desulfovibrio sp.]